jgi:hypothetical protein
MTYQKGQSGNPAGRPPGIKDRRVELRELFQPKAKDLVAKAIEMALAGDTACLRLCIERVVPAMKSQDAPAPNVSCRR